MYYLVPISILNTSTLKGFFLHEPIYGAYTELFAGLSPDVTASKNGAWSKHPSFYRPIIRVESIHDSGIFHHYNLHFSHYTNVKLKIKKVIPWGRFAPALRQDLVASLKTKAEGGTGIAAEFWEWSEEQVKPYV